jgi:hypothetical protein
MGVKVSVEVGVSVRMSVRVSVRVDVSGCEWMRGMGDTPQAAKRRYAGSRGGGTHLVLPRRPVVAQHYIPDPAGRLVADLADVDLRCSGARGTRDIKTFRPRTFRMRTISSRTFKSKTSRTRTFG